MVVLITGVSGGLGKVLANYLSEQGMTVYGTSRSGTGSIDGCTLIPMEISNSESIASALKTVQQKEGRIDAIINCVNQMIIGSVEETPVEDFRSVFESNVIGAYNICRQILPIFKAQNKGLIINMSSAGGELAIPYMAAYTSAKFALEAFSEALYHELRDSPIDVVIMQPVAMKMDRAATGHHLGLSSAVGAKSKSHAMVEMMAKDTEESKLTPEKVSKKIYEVLINKKRPLRVRMDRAKVLAFIKRVAPQSALNAIYKKLLPV